MGRYNYLEGDCIEDNQSKRSQTKTTTKYWKETLQRVQIASTGGRDDALFNGRHLMASPWQQASVCSAVEVAKMAKLAKLVKMGLFGVLFATFLKQMCYR